MTAPMTRWTVELVLAELRWATLKPTSRRFNDQDPAGLVGTAVDVSAARAAITDWLLDIATECHGAATISTAGLTAWKARLGYTADAGPASTRRVRVHRVAAAVAEALHRPTPRIVAPRPILRLNSAYRVSAVGLLPERMLPSSSTQPLRAAFPQGGAERQRCYRRRLAERFERARDEYQVSLHRTEVLTPHPGEHVSMISARLLAREAIDGGTAFDAAVALRDLYEVLNNREDIGAATAARWSAELFANDPVSSYFMFNAELGVVVRHIESAVGQQVDWANRTMQAAFRELNLRDMPAALAYTIVIRHTERFAHTVLTRNRVNGFPLNREHWRHSHDEIFALTRRALDGELVDTDPGWQSVVLQRYLELVIVGLGNGLVSGGPGELVRSVQATDQLLREYGGVLPALRLAQLHRLRARAGVVLRVPDLIAYSLELGKFHGQEFPGQLVQLDWIRQYAKGFGLY
jgi:hypothetical protein